MIARLTVKHEMATQTHNRILSTSRTKTLNLPICVSSSRTLIGPRNLTNREAQLKQELDSSRERMESLRPATFKIQITLRDGSVDPEYVLEVRHIDFIVYYEELFCVEPRQLLEEGRIPLAYDLLLLVARRDRINSAPLQFELESEEKGADRARREARGGTKRTSVVTR